jgi:hypothetical protein
MVPDAVAGALEIAVIGLLPDPGGARPVRPVRGAAGPEPLERRKRSDITSDEI